MARLSLGLGDAGQQVVRDAVEFLPVHLEREATRRVVIGCCCSQKEEEMRREGRLVTLPTSHDRLLRFHTLLIAIG